jgi:hypothetical protein
MSPPFLQKEANKNVVKNLTMLKLWSSNNLPKGRSWPIFIAEIS